MDARVFVLKTPRCSSIRYPSRIRSRELDLSGSRDNPTAERNGGGKNGEEAKEEHRGVSPFLSRPDSKNRHKSRQFIICVGRHDEDTIGWRTCG